MNITIAKRNSKLQTVRQHDLDSLIQPIDMVCTQSSNKSHCVWAKEKNSEKEINVQKGTAQWILGPCFRTSQHSYIGVESQHNYSQNEPAMFVRSKNCRLTTTNNSVRQHKIKVSGSKPKTNQESRQYPKSLQKVRDMKSQQKAKTSRQHREHNLNEIIVSKKCSETNHTPIYSQTASAIKYRNSQEHSTAPVNHSSSQKIRMTISKESKQKRRSQDLMNLSEKDRFVQQNINKGCSFKNKSLIGSDAFKTATAKGSNFYQSSSEVKIVDPFDELRSVDTEYLKKKMFYSEARSEKDESPRINHQSILNQDNIEQFKSHLVINRRPFYAQAHRSMAQVDNERQDISKSLEQSHMSDEMSVVLEKGSEQIFNIKLQKFSTADKSRKTLRDSMTIYESFYREDEINQGEVCFASLH